METSSEELGRILREKGRELPSGMERRCQKVKALKPCRDFTWPKSYLALLDTTAKSSLSWPF